MNHNPGVIFFGKTVCFINNVLKFLNLGIMKKIFLQTPLLFFVFMFTDARSQESRNIIFELGLHGSAEISTPAWGAGAKGRVIFPLSNGNYISGEISFDRVKEKAKYTGNVYKYNFFGLYGGYRKMIQSVFIEPVIGGGYSAERHPWGVTSGLFFSGGITGGVHLGKFTLSSGIRLMMEDGIIFGESYVIVNAGVAIRL
jgi:hypothetical protein